MQQSFVAENQLGYQQIGSLNTATALTIPAGASLVLVTPETQAVRWRADGTDPTASAGYPLAAGVEAKFTIRQLAAIKFIEQAASAKINVYYFGN